MRRVAGYNIPVTVNSMCGGFAAERRAGGQEISISRQRRAAQQQGARQRLRAVTRSQRTKEALAGLSETRSHTSSAFYS